MSNKVGIYISGLGQSCMRLIVDKLQEKKFI